MDAPPIQYARTPDAVNIAYSATGDGPCFVHGSWAFNHIQRYWDSPVWRPWFEALAGRFRLIQYDARNFGLSQRGVAEVSREAGVADLAAVVEATESRDLLLLTEFPALAVDYAARYPEKVAGLVLWGPGFAESPDVEGVVSLYEENWDFALRAIAQTINWLDPDEAGDYTEVLRAAFTQEDAIRHVAGDERTLASLDLEAVAVPVLVLSPRRLSTPESHQAVAARIPDATLATVDGTAIPDVTRLEATIRAIEMFADRLFSGVAAEAAGPLQIIFFTDLEASTPLTQRLGDERAQELLRGHNTTVRAALDEHGGREVKHTGDGIMASFPPAVSAVTAALQIQRGLAGGEVRVRVGLNAGEPIAEDDDLFGLSVIKAARIADRAEPGTVLVSDVVKQLCEGKTFEFSSLGAVSLKGFDEAVTLFEVQPGK